MSDRCTPPPNPCFRIFEKHVRELKPLEQEPFLKLLCGTDGSDLFPSSTSKPPSGDLFSINNFINLANWIAKSVAKSNAITGEYQFLCTYIFFDDT